MSLPNYSLRAALSYAAVSCPADVIVATIMSGRDDATRRGHEIEEEEEARRALTQSAQRIDDHKNSKLVILNYRYGDRV